MKLINIGWIIIALILAVVLAIWFSLYVMEQIHIYLHTLM